MQAIKRVLNQFQFVRDLDLKIRGPKWRPQDIDLTEIESRTLPPDETFRALAARAEIVEGMLSRFSMAIMDMLLSEQRNLGVKGDLLEIGTYRGKSAVILGHHLQGSERLTLVDIHDYLDRKAIAPFAGSVDFLLTDSARLDENIEASRRFRFIHIDASHGYHETFRELQLADRHLAPLGIIAMDDFANLLFGQNIAAIFKYLFTSRTDLVLFLTTMEKGYLCHRRDANIYLRHILTQSVAALASRGIGAQLARTSYSTEFRPFHLCDRQEGESPLYGKGIYRNQILGL